MSTPIIDLNDSHKVFVTDQIRSFKTHKFYLNNSKRSVEMKNYVLISFTFVGVPHRIILNDDKTTIQYLVVYISKQTDVKL